MRRTSLTLLAVLGALSLPVTVVAEAVPLAPIPKSSAGQSAYAAFAPLIGKTWRGQGIGPAGGTGVEDVQRWEWSLGGQAIRITHSVNNGAYAGETLVFRNPEGDGYVYTYVTTGGFYTTGTIQVTATGGYTAEETVHGVQGLDRLRMTASLGADGVYRTRGSMEKDGQWVETGGVDYRQDPDAMPVMPAMK